MHVLSRRVGAPSSAGYLLITPHTLQRMVTWLSPLTGLALPSSKCVATRGLSLRSATLAGSTPITLVDSEGSLAPVAMRHAHSLLERQAAPPTTARHHLPLLTTSTLHGSLVNPNPNPNPADH